jgi:hypothetical protein
VFGLLFSIHRTLWLLYYHQTTGGAGMPRIRIELDEETYRALMHKSDEECRPLAMQAGVLIRQSLGLPFPYPPIIDVDMHQARPALIGRES